MAVEPLFIATLDALKAQLRLSSTTDADGLAIIDGSIQEVRIGFNDCLSESRITEILAFASVDNPATADERTRTRAEKTEVMWVRILLITRLPNFFLDSSGAVPQVFNEEGLTRESRRDAKDRELDRLNAELIKSIDLLKGGTDCTIENEVQASTICPDVAPPLPFGSIAPILLPTTVPIAEPV